MSLVRFLIILSIGTAMSWIAWALVLTTLDPLSNGLIAPFLFYVSGWLATVGTMTLIGFFIRYWLEKEKVPFEQIATALRQAVILSSGLVLTLVLQRAHLLNGWSLAVLLLLVGTIEFFFLADQASRPRHSSRGSTA